MTQRPNRLTGARPPKSLARRLFIATLVALVAAVAVAPGPRTGVGAVDRRANDYMITVRSPVNVSASARAPIRCHPDPPDPNLQAEANVEPRLAVNPRLPNQLTAVWQQGRWEDGGAASIGAATSSTDR